MKRLVVLFTVLTLALPAQAHTRDELDQWVEEWVVEADIGLSGTLLDSWEDMEHRHPYYFNPPVISVSFSTGSRMGTNVEQWRVLVAAYFRPEDVDRALCLMSYESGGNPDAYNPSGARGLMQVLGGHADNYGVTKEDLFDPSINLFIAADLRYSYGWTQWSPYNRGLCR